MTALRVTFGVDPGLTGAVATLLDGVPGPILDMPVVQVGDWREVDARSLAAWIREVRQQHPGAHFSACVEKVGARPNDGGTTAFRFGEGYGQIKAVLSVLGLGGFSRAIPAVWKRHMGLLKTEKDAARLLAISRFPSAAHLLQRKKHSGRADALLLALWHENTQLHGQEAA